MGEEQCLRVAWVSSTRLSLLLLLVCVVAMANSTPASQSYCDQLGLPEWLCFEKSAPVHATGPPLVKYQPSPVEEVPAQTLAELELDNAATKQHEDVYSKEGDYAQRIRTFGDLDKAQLVVLVDCGDNAYGAEVCSNWETDLDEFGPEPFNLVHFTLVFGRSTSDWFADNAHLMGQLMVGPHTPNMLISLVPPEVPTDLYDEIHLNADGHVEFDLPKGLPIISIPFNTRHQMCAIGERNLTVTARWLCEASTGMNGQHCTISQLFSTDMMDSAYHEIGVPLVFSVSNMEHFLDPLISITTVNLRKLSRYANGLK